MTPDPGIDRRTALRLGAAAAVGMVVPGCVPRQGHLSTGSPSLFPVRVDESRIIRRVVGLRPYRPLGFVVRAEQLDDTLLVHNYGHGGGGITLSWGTSHLAVRIAETEGRTRAGTTPRAAVLGCGVVGLSTARLLQRRGWDVTIYARDLPPQTTSNVAGGQWTPASVYQNDLATPAFMDQFTSACRLAYREFQDLVGSDYGVSWADNYYLDDDPPEPLTPHSLSVLIPDVFRVTQLEPREHPFAARYAFRVTTMIIEPAIYLSALLRDARIAGATVNVRALTSRQEVASLPERVVINCTGLGAADLFGDDDLTPVKGQLTILQPQPEVDYLALKDGLYMFPRADGILLGGTFERGVSSLDVNEAAERRILDGHTRLFGSMRT